MRRTGSQGDENQGPVISNIGREGSARPTVTPITLLALKGFKGSIDRGNTLRRSYQHYRSEPPLSMLIEVLLLFCVCRVFVDFVFIKTKPVKTGLTFPTEQSMAGINNNVFLVPFI
jgi:hypothetical protein